MTAYPAKSSPVLVRRQLPPATPESALDFMQLSPRLTGPLAEFTTTLPRLTSKKGLVVYTAILAGYDTLAAPSHGDANVDHVCFTDDPSLRVDGWTVVPVPQLYRDPRRTARVYKMLPHLLFPESETTLWVDGACVMRTSPVILARRYLGETRPGLFCFRHPVRRRVAEERLACTRGGKEDPVLLRAQASAYEAAGFPDNGQLVATGVLLRRSLHAEVAAFGEHWLTEVDGFSARDQLSFNFVAWREQFHHGLFPMPLGDNEFCTWRPHPRFVFYDRHARRMRTVRSTLDWAYARIRQQAGRLLLARKT